MMDKGMTGSRIAFRADASLEIGTGHVMRCLTLADTLREQGADCLFLCRRRAGRLANHIEARGHRVALLSAPEIDPGDSGLKLRHAAWLGTSWQADAIETSKALEGAEIDWLIVDHYALDHRWESELRPSCRHLMVMDDLADRAHDCNLLLDPTLGRKTADYAHLISREATSLLGPAFALLRPEFAALRTESLARREHPVLRRLLVTMGGADNDNATEKVLDALESSALPPDLRIVVVMGSHAPWLHRIRERAIGMRNETEVQVGVQNMARLMTDSDLAIGAAGGTSWERCCLGLPTIQFVVAANQAGIADQLSKLGAAICADSKTLPRVFSEMVDGVRSGKLAEQSRIASSITDGFGSQRVAAKLRDDSNE